MLLINSFSYLFILTKCNYEKRPTAKLFGEWVLMAGGRVRGMRDLEKQVRIKMQENKSRIYNNNMKVKTLFIFRDSK